MEACESNSLMPSTLSDSQNTLIEEKLNESHQQPNSNAAESNDDTKPTSESEDPNNRIFLIQQPHPKVKEADETVIFSPDLFGSISGRRDSEASSLATTDSSEVYSFLEEPTGLRWLYVEYWYQMRFLKRKGYLLPFEIICLAFTIACCFMGAYYWPLCPADVYIPRYVFFNGAIATFSVCIEVMNSLFKRFLLRYHGKQKYLCAFGLGWIAFTTTLIEMIEFYTMSYSFQRHEENYCNETFYWFVYYKNITFGVLMPLVAMIYAPNFDYYNLIQYV